MFSDVHFFLVKQSTSKCDFSITDQRSNIHSVLSNGFGGDYRAQTNIIALGPSVCISARDQPTTQARGALAICPPFGASLPLPETECRKLLKNASLSFFHVPPMLQNTASLTKFLYRLQFHLKKKKKIKKVNV